MLLLNLAAATALLLVASSAPQAKQDAEPPSTAHVATDRNSATTDPHYVKTIWATNTSVILILDVMPDGVSYFRVDQNQDQKLKLLLFAAEHKKRVQITYDKETQSRTRAVFEVRLTLAE